MKRGCARIFPKKITVCSLSAPLYLVVAFTTFVFSPFLYTTLIFSNIASYLDTCRDNWWHTFLYVRWRLNRLLILNENFRSKTISMMTMWVGDGGGSQAVAPLFLVLQRHLVGCEPRAWLRASNVAASLERGSEQRTD